VRVGGVVKRFGSTTALAGVDLEVREGMVFGLLGQNSRNRRSETHEAVPMSSSRLVDAAGAHWLALKYELRG
jgi:ABC-type branched-subunit amino acid transport system ATPase component